MISAKAKIELEKRTNIYFEVETQEKTQEIRVGEPFLLVKAFKEFSTSLLFAKFIKQF